LDLEGANETDVREEVVTPLLAALGYVRGTSNGIAREPSLRYERLFLGRKKNTDPPLRGRADYVLSVMGAGRWVLEVKAPHEPIDIDVIEQAISYGRHPEVAASYAVVLNGRRLTVHYTTQRSTDPPVVDLPIFDVATLAEQLIPLLSPAAIRRDCSCPRVDLARPLAPGLRSQAEVLRGEFVHKQFRWSSNVALPSHATAPLEEMSHRLSGFRVAIIGGTVGRDASSRIRAKLKWSLPHDELLAFAMDKKLLDAEYIALNEDISTNPGQPTVFDVVGEIEVAAGEPVFNIAQWETVTAGMPTNMRYNGTATGYISDYVFQGTVSATYYSDFPSVPFLKLQMMMEGTFRIELDRR